MREAGALGKEDGLEGVVGTEESFSVLPDLGEGLCVESSLPLEAAGWQGFRGNPVFSSG